MKAVSKAATSWAHTGLCGCTQAVGGSGKNEVREMARPLRSMHFIQSTSD